MTATQVPGPQGSVLLGSLRELRRDPLAAYLAARRDFGDVVRFTAGPVGMRVSFYALLSAEGAQHLLATRTAAFRKDHSFYNEVRDLIGNGLLTSQDDEYLRQRRLIQPLFTKKRVNEYALAMAAETADLTKRWRDAPGGVVDVAEEMTGLTLRIVTRVLFGADGVFAEDAIKRSFPTLSESVVRRGFSPLRLPRGLPTPQNRRISAAQTALYRVCDRIIAERRGRDTEGVDLLSRLAQAGDSEDDRLSDPEIRDQVLVFLLAGHETTATSLAFALHLLARNPEIQRRAREEIGTVLKDEPPSAADYERLPYTTMVVKEAMRLYPAAPILGRLAVDDTEVDGFRIPAGSNVLTSAWVIHRHPRYWEDPERFDPSRFTAEREAARPRYAWIPFGGGPRACIGQHFSMLESVLALAVMLREYSFSAVDTEVKVRSGITLRAAGPLRCRIREH
ncbi:MAG: cytochrome P450 [Stackebrandtia sp.]